MMNTVFITGANKGIGFALSKTMAKQGWRVILGARDKAKAESAVSKLKNVGVDNIEYVLVDLEDSDKIEDTLSEIKERFSSINLLINNAGVPGKHETSLNTELTDLKNTMQVNFFGTFQLTQGLLPLLEKNNGRIVNITIPTKANPFWNPFAYKATKAAQNVMMNSLAIDFTKENRTLEIFSIHPGPTTTDLNGNISAEGFHSPEDVAQKMSSIILDGKSHQGEFIEIYNELEN